MQKAFVIQSLHSSFIIKVILTMSRRDPGEDQIRALKKNDLKRFVRVPATTTNLF